MLMVVTTPVAVSVLAQAALLYATVAWVLHIHIDRPDLFSLTLALSSVTFLCIVIALTRVMGDAGKAVRLSPALRQA